MLLQGADQRAGMKTPDWTRTQRDPPRHQEPQVQSSRGPGTGLVFSGSSDWTAKPPVTSRCRSHKANELASCDPRLTCNCSW